MSGGRELSFGGSGGRMRLRGLLPSSFLIARGSPGKGSGSHETRGTGGSSGTAGDHAEPCPRTEFPTDENFLDFISREAGPAEGDRILEVGPGLGVLTSRLLASGAQVTAVELDGKLAAWLRTTLVPRGLRLIEGDACRVDVASIFGPETPFRLISNLPYSAGTVVVARMLDLLTPPSDMLVLLQKEVALRLAAEPGTPDYSALSVRIQASYEVSLPRKTVPPALFYPRPEVDSSLVKMVRKEPCEPQEFRMFLSRFVRTAFAHRRKKMFRQLTALADPDKLRDAMARTDVDPETRAERVSPEQFVAMAKILRDQAPASA